MEDLRDKLLQHKGKANQITSKRIGEFMGYPVVVDNNGYFIALTKIEMYRYNKNLQSRIDKIEKRKQKANEIFEEINK